MSRSNDKLITSEKMALAIRNQEGFLAPSQIANLVHQIYGGKIETIRQYLYSSQGRSLLESDGVGSYRLTPEGKTVAESALEKGIRLGLLDESGKPIIQENKEKADEIEVDSGVEQIIADDDKIKHEKRQDKDSGTRLTLHEMAAYILIECGPQTIEGIMDLAREDYDYEDWEKIGPSIHIGRGTIHFSWKPVDRSHLKEPLTTIK